MRSFAESSTYNLLRALQRKVLYSATTLLLATSACKSSCQETRHVDDQQSAAVWNVADASPPLIPDEVEWAVQGKPRELQRILQLASQDVPPNHVPPLIKQLLQLNLPKKDNHNSLESLGFTENSLVTIVHANHDTILAFRNTDRDTIDATVSNWTLQKSIRMRTSDVEGNRIHLTWNDSPDSQYLFTVVNQADDSWVFVALPEQFRHDDAAAQTKAIQRFGETLHSWSTLDGKRWRDRFENIDTAKKQYFNSLSAYGTLRLDLILKDETTISPSDPPHLAQSKKLKKQLLSELGEFDLFALLDPQETHLSLTIEQSNAVQPESSPLASLGLPPVNSPYFSTLAPAGTLGIIHLAFDPSTFFNFTTSLLPDDSRDTLTSRLNEYLEKGDLDVQKDLIENLSGHATAFIYGLASDTFQQIAHGSLADLLLLKYARKAILIPVKNTTQAVEFLDITTQLFKDNLVRKGNGFNNIEYIWHDGNQVKWGILVKDHALIYVDSYAAYQNALAYDGTSVATIPELNNRSNSAILTAESRFRSNDHDAGILLDLESLQTLLAEDSYYAAWAAWLAPYSSALVVSSTSDNKTILELDLTIRKPDNPTSPDNDVSPLPFFVPHKPKNARPN